MFHHAPPGYVCPFCMLVQNRENTGNLLKQTDIVLQSRNVTALVATRKYPGNPGHVLIIPNEHFENIYDLPLSLSSKIHALSREVALAMKLEYRCDGITLWQHNEPAGDQNIWHYHLHIIPRFRNDDFRNAPKVPFESDERALFAQKLRNGFKTPRASETE